MSVASTSLVNLLSPTATRVRTVGFKLIKLMTKLTGEMLSKQDVEHYAYCAAFEAFLELGGDPDNPTAFDWVSNTAELEKSGLRWLRRETIGRKSEFGDVSTRVTVRKNSAIVDCYRWSAWTHANLATGVSHRKTPNVPVVEYIVEAAQERQIRDEKVETFEDDLRAVVSGRDFEWMVERYRDGVPQTVQIERFVRENPSYQNAGGVKRAEAYINKQISRARQRAQALLADKWQGIAQEVSA